MSKLSDLFCSCLGFFSEKNVKKGYEKLEENEKNLKRYDQEFAKLLANYTDSEECNKQLEDLLPKLSWSFTYGGATGYDGFKSNSVLLAVIAKRKQKITNTVIDYIEKNKLFDQMVKPDTDTKSCNNTPLILAIKENNIETIKRIIQYYGKDTLMHLNAIGNSGLHLAALKGQNEVIKLILDRAEELGCTEEIIQQKNACGWTADYLYELKWTDNYPYYSYQSLEEDDEKIIYTGPRLKGWDTTEDGRSYWVVNNSKLNPYDNVDESYNPDEHYKVQEMVTDRCFFDLQIGNYQTEIVKHGEYTDPPSHKDKSDSDLLDRLQGKQNNNKIKI